MPSSYYKTQVKVDLSEVRKSIVRSFNDGHLDAFIILQRIKQHELEERCAMLKKDDFDKNMVEIKMLSYQIQTYTEIFDDLPKGEEK